MFTASPVAKVDSPESTTTSPASIPMRASRPSSLTRLHDPERRPDGALGVVLVRLRDAERRHHGVAGELLHDPAVRDHAVRDAVEELLHAAARRPPDRCRRRGPWTRPGRRTAQLRAFAPPLSVETTRSAVRTASGGRSSRAPAPGSRRLRSWSPPSARPVRIASACSTRRSSRPTTSAGSTRPSWTRRARTRSGAPTSRSSSRARSPSAATCGCPRRRWPRRRSEGAVDGGADVLDLGLVGTEMVYFAVGERGARRRDHGHRLAQPEGVHGHEDRPRRRAAGRRRLGPDGGPRPRRAGIRGPARRSGGHASVDVWPGFVDRVLSFVDVDAIKPLRVVIDAANGMAGAMLPPVLERLPIDAVRCYFEPDGIVPEPRAEPAAAGEPRVHRRARRPRGGRRLRRRVRRRRRPLLLRRRRGELRPGRLRHRALRRARPREGAGREDHLRRPRELGRARDDRGGRRHPADQPRRPRLHQAADARGRTRSSAARSPATTTSATSARPTPASSRSCSCSSSSRRSGQKLSEILRPFRERYFITGELNTPVPDVDAKLAGARGALRRRRTRSRTSTGSRSTPTNGTSTSGRRTRSRCCGSTSRPAPRS